MRVFPLEIPGPDREVPNPPGRSPRSQRAGPAETGCIER